MTDQNRQLLALSAQIVAAHAGNNPIGVAALPSIIESVYRTLADLTPALTDADGARGEDVPHERGHREHSDHQFTQAYVHPTYGQTVFGDRLICMEDGLSMKMLKRHLLTVHGMTPEEYRSKWGLPDTYPMVALEYARLRSSLALQSGLGLKPEDRSRKARKSRGNRS